MLPLARFPVAALLSLAAAAASAAPASIAVADAYDMHDAADADTVEAMAGCIGGSADDVANFAKAHAKPGDHTRAELDARQPGTATGAVVAAGPFWACVAFSPEGFPVWPVEALAAAITIRGVEPSVSAEWSRKVLAQAAHDGQGHGLVILTTGDGMQFDIIAEQHRASLLHYTSHKVPKAEIDRSRFAAVVDDPHFAGTSTMRMGTADDGSLPVVFAIPDARLRKPADGEYVRERADDLTARFDFTGTRWRFGGKGLDAVLELQADGQAVETRKVGAQDHKTTGTWRVEGGVLHVALGAARFSLVLDGDRSLTGDGRRKLFPGEPVFGPAQGTDGDFRWTVSLQRA